MNLMGLALVAVLVMLGARKLYAKRPKQRERTKMRDLLLACHGDQMVAERLIFAELQRAPGLDFGEAAHRAHQRLQRDRR